MHVLFSPLVEEKLKKIKKQDNKLFKKVEKQVHLFRANPKHPSLRLHKLTSKTESIWSISITMSIRMMYKIVDDDAYFIDIGTHDEVYRK